MMLYELTQPEFHRAMPLFDTPHLALVARSVACDNTPGLPWADDLFHPRVALLWDRRHHLYLAGDAAAADTAGIRSLLRRIVLPGMLAQGSSGYEAHASCEALARVWQEILPNASRRPRVLLTRRTENLPASTLPVDPILRLRPIDAALLQDEDLAHVEDVRHEVASMWGSVEAFLRGGFGYCMATDGQIVCWCTAEYVSLGRCGIGIETIPAYQRHGLATATATAFLSYCATHGIQPYWDCWTDNVPSARVAEKIGLMRIEEYDVYCGMLEDLRSQRTSAAI
jgi:GNAT superfamily N-acetyltransferase